MRAIPLSKGYAATVDDCDYKRVSAYKWHAHPTNHSVYARACIEGKNVYMHRFLLQAPSKMEVDHIDHNGLNNTRENLRLATKSQNARNARLRKDNTSGIRDVLWDKKSEKWRAYVVLDGKQYHVGYFTSLKEAEEAACSKRLELHKEFYCDKQ
jgi:hypothetical protein